MSAWRLTLGACSLLLGAWGLALAAKTTENSFVFNVSDM